MRISGRKRFFFMNLKAIGVLDFMRKLETSNYILKVIDFFLLNLVLNDLLLKLLKALNIKLNEL